jgi:hypothetical protein
MPDVTIPARASLESLTDEKLAWERDQRAKFKAADCLESRLILAAAEGVAGLVRQQFPGPGTGRIFMAGMQALASAAQVYGIEDVNTLVTIAGLAAEQLDREASDRD